MAVDATRPSQIAVNMHTLALLFAALSLAVSVKAQKPCCGPTKFIAGSGSTVGLVSGGVPQGSETYVYGAFDFDNHEYGYFVSADLPGNSTVYRVILKYSENSQWIIDDSKKVCKKLPITLPEPSVCIPSNATFDAYLSFGGKMGLTAESWSYQLGPPQYPFYANATVTVVKGSCYPLITSLIGGSSGPEEFGLVSTSGTVNMTIGIPDPDTWFKVPDFCEQEDNDIFSRHPRSHPELKFYHLPTFF